MFMNMKVLAFILMAAGILLVAPVLTLAEDTSPSATKRIENLKQKVEDVRENIKARVEEPKLTREQIREEKTIKVRKSIIAIFESYSRLTMKAGQLLDKLQARIDRAKAAGENTTAAETAMKDARVKLADATKILDDIKGKKDTAVDKPTFLQIRKKLQTVHKDLNAIRLDAAKIISSLRSFNSQKESTKSSEKSE
ncbi:MAG: hypothetical protein UU67_C0012G0009 [Candidatus Daviesbacteria bacterium GW2011_GWB1_41_5]|uniref:Uncharacterized protein n=2 Tax=Candidatus Daviesiibacteriota TaxID=1752718 RepID=A0A0G0WMB7_9BACT|nr:MAG: hypothetical protein UU67_C0012G0009 [Candidatus Daviesbacteria bacterium GW2011_GWB1_41_5]